jgi:hypothetical protein
MKAGALTYVDMTGARARREATLPASSRPHAYAAGRCVRCLMLETWPGARYACEGSSYTCAVGERGRCDARRGRGGQCHKRAVLGATRCETHGGRRVTGEAGR